MEAQPTATSRRQDDTGTTSCLCWSGRLLFFLRVFPPDILVEQIKKKKLLLADDLTKIDSRKVGLLEGAPTSNLNE